MHINLNVRIDRSTPEVFAFVTEPSNAALIYPGARIIAESPGQLGPGTRYQIVIERPRRAPVIRDCTVLEYDANRRLVTQVDTASGGRLIDEVDFMSEGGSTLVRYSSRTVPTGFFSRIVLSLMVFWKPTIRRHIQTQFDRIRIQLECGA
ncbi:MAG: hypothetical protein AB7I09_19635 [Planctomycetota bacterium]